jgi:hypothetical protein
MHPYGYTWCIVSSFCRPDWTIGRRLSARPCRRAAADLHHHQEPQRRNRRRDPPGSTTARPPTPEPDNDNATAATITDAWNPHRHPTAFATPQFQPGRDRHQLQHDSVRPRRPPRLPMRGSHVMDMGAAARRGRPPIASMITTWTTPSTRADRATRTTRNVPVRHPQSTRPDLTRSPLGTSFGPFKSQRSRPESGEPVHLGPPEAHRAALGRLSANTCRNWPQNGKRRTLSEEKTRP